MTATPAAATEKPARYSAEDNHTALPIGWEMFVFGLAILSIVNMFVVLLARLAVVDQVVVTVDVVLSLIFLTDFFARLRNARDRRLYFIQGLGWLDLISCVPFLRFARIVRIGRVIRKLRSEGGLSSTLAALGDARASSSLILVVFVAILMWEFGSLAILAVEARAENGNIKTASDALWYSLVTMSTVGYGDRFPVTDLGRFIGSIIIIVGVGLFGTITGFLANAFLAPKKPATPDPEAAVGSASEPAPATAEPTGP
jgi:voltage-gated potassium channel